MFLRVARVSYPNHITAWYNKCLYTSNFCTCLDTITSETEVDGIPQAQAM